MNEIDYTSKELNPHGCSEHQTKGSHEEVKKLNERYGDDKYHISWMNGRFVFSSKETEI